MMGLIGDASEIPKPPTGTNEPQAALIGRHRPQWGVCGFGRSLIERAPIDQARVIILDWDDTSGPGPVAVGLLSCSFLYETWSKFS